MKKVLSLILSVIFILSLTAFVACRENSGDGDSSSIISSSDNSGDSSSAARDSYTVTVENGEGSGEYEKNTLVTITATVPEGKAFVKWISGNEDISTRNPYVFVVSKDITLTAVFEDVRDSYTVTVENGTGSGEYAKDTRATVTATVPKGKKFVKWVSGNEDISTKNPYVFVVSKDITLTAVFEDETEIDVIHNDAVLVKAKDYYFDFEEGLDNFASSEKAFAFDYKAVDNVANTGNGFQFTMWGPGWTPLRRTDLVTVNVVDNTVSVGRIKALDDGWYRVIILASELPVNRGEGATGEELLGSFVVNTLDHAFMLDEAGFFDVESGDIIYKITVKNGTGGGEYPRGEEATVVANEIEGKTFKEWQINGQKVSDNPTYTFKVKGNATVVAIYSSMEDILANSVLIVGDVHVGKEPVCKTNLIKTLQYVKNNERIKVVIFNGDTVDTSDEANYALLDECFETVFGDVPKADRPEFLFNMGNHEFYKDSNCVYKDTVYSRDVGRFKAFANKWMSEPIGETESVYMRTIGGISYIIAFPSSSLNLFGDGYEYASCGEFRESDFEALQIYLAEATADNRPCVVATHWPWGFTYGGSTYGMPNANIVNRMTELFKNYPSIISVTSHTHFSDLHERSFDQTYYTTVNVGTHCLGKHFGGSIIENGVETGGFEDENGELATYMNLSRRGINSKADLTAHSIYWSGTVHFGIGLDFNSESATIKRINIGKGEDYAHGEWIVPYGITTENYHDKFSYEAGERSGETLEFAEGAKLSAEITSTGSTKSTIALSFTDVENYWAVEGYKIEIYNKKNELIYKTWWQSLFWADLGEKSTYSITINDVPTSDSYTVKVYPMDFFSHYNEPITAVIGDVEPIIENLENYTKTVYASDGEDFVILNLTDYQLHDGKSTYVPFTIIDELVAQYNPDMITVLGDTAEDDGNYDTKVNFKAFVDYIDALNIPWAPIYGNHDNDNYLQKNSKKVITSEWINNTFMSAQNCLFSVGPDSVTGNGNYIVNVVNSTTGEIVKTLVFVDSGTIGVDATHVAFYEQAILYSTSLNDGKTPESIVCLHIPLPEYRTIYNNEDYFGIAGETPSASGTTAFFAKIKELGSTKHVICGHDHVNSFYGLYEGVYLMYCLKSSDGDYYNENQLGGTVFTIGEETTFEYHLVDVTFEIISKQIFNIPATENFVSSGKAFTFEYKPSDNAANAENIMAFTFWEGGRSSWGNRVSELITIDVVNDTITGCEGTIQDIGDGWRKVTINCADIPIYTTASTGEETVSMIYFNTVGHAFFFNNAGFVGGTPVVKKYDVKVVHGSGSGTYNEGDQVTVTAEVIEGKTFVEWQVGGVRVSTDNPYTFTVTGKIKLTAVYDPPITESKEYLDSGYEIELPDYDDSKAVTLEFDLYTANTETRVNIVLTDENGVSTKYYRISSAGVNTSYNGEGVSYTKENNYLHIVFNLSELTNGSGTSLGKIVKMSDSGSTALDGSWIDNIAFYGEKAKYTVTVEGGTGGGEYQDGSNATVIATVPEGKNFVEWQIGGEKVSDTAEYTFKVTGDVTITAVFEDKAAGDTKVMLTSGFSIDLPAYDPASATTLEFDVYAVPGSSSYAKINIVLTDENNVSTKYYRVTYLGVNTGYNNIGVSCSKIADDTWHVVFNLSELKSEGGVSLGKLVKMTDGGSSNLGGSWIDNIGFKS